MSISRKNICRKNIEKKKKARRPMPRRRFYLDALQVRRAGRHEKTSDICA
jgi:hypothetical protein